LEEYFGLQEMKIRRSKNCLHVGQFFCLRRVFVFNFIHSSSWWVLLTIGIISFAISSYLFNFLGTHAGKPILSLTVLACQAIIWYKFGFMAFLSAAIISSIIAVLVAWLFGRLSGEEEYYG